jgi:hypothetical protein
VKCKHNTEKGREHLADMGLDDRISLRIRLLRWTLDLAGFRRALVDMVKDHLVLERHTVC